MFPLLATYGLSALAGVLSTLSPCVLPLIPILMGSAVSAHPRGPLGLAAGVALSFTVVGVLLASVGAAIGLDGDSLRQFGAVLMIAVAVLLLSPVLQMHFAKLATRATSPGHALLAHVQLGGVGGQFALGLLLGLVWSPCVGPTLGAAATLASQGQDLGRVALLMAVFGLGASLPMLVIGRLSRTALSRNRGSLAQFAERGKRLLGVALMVLGTLVLSGTDRHLESWLVAASPEWLTALTTRY